VDSKCRDYAVGAVPICLSMPTCHLRRRGARARGALASPLSRTATRQCNRRHHLRAPPSCVRTTDVLVSGDCTRAAASWCRRAHRRGQTLPRQSRAAALLRPYWSATSMLLCNGLQAHYRVFLIVQRRHWTAAHWRIMPAQAGHRGTAPARATGGVCLHEKARKSSCVVRAIDWADWRGSC